MTGIVDIMQNEAANAFKTGRFAELTEAFKLAMIARNRIRFYGVAPPVQPVRDVPMGVPMRRACLFLDCGEDE